MTIGQAMKMQGALRVAMGYGKLTADDFELIFNQYPTLMRKLLDEINEKLMNDMEEL